MALSPEFKTFGPKALGRVRDVFIICQEEVERSIREGSSLTGAPGQPDDTGALRKSWNGYDLAGDVWEFSTSSNYALYIEEGGNSRGPFIAPPGGKRVRRGILRSRQVGGFHSVKLTRAAWQQIVRFASKKTGAS